MLSRTSRWLTFVMLGLYTLLGLLLFLAPSWSAANFPWKISPLVAMTIGGWCLGNAVVAWVAGRVWRWSAVFSSVLYLWCFALMEIVVVLLFRAKLVLNTPLAWLYILTLGVGLVSAVVGVVDWLRLRPSAIGLGQPMIPFARIMTILIIITVGVVGTLGWFGATSRVVTEQLIFPDSLSAFTVRAFAAFYLSIALTALPLLWVGEQESTLAYSRSVLGLIVFTTAAAFFNLNKFNFATHPGGLLYFAIYILVFCAIVYVLSLEARGRDNPTMSRPLSFGNKEE